jgi:UTP--glucose-1-phosphate uridylyltransferase
MTKKIRTAIFPVGGLGTRFLPATKVMPKEMLPIVDKPLIQYAFEEAVNSGIERFIFITGRNKNVISNHFDHAYELEKTLEEKQKDEVLALTRGWVPPAGSIAFIRQQKPLGLGHAILCAENFIGDEPFAVLLADELFLCDADKPALKQMMNAHAQVGGGNIIGVKEELAHRVSSYGIIDPSDKSTLGTSPLIKAKGMVEKPKPEDAPSNLAITGRYVLEPEIFKVLNGQAAGSGGEIQLTDAMHKMAVSGTNTHAVVIDGRRFDCGGRKGFLEANIAFALEIPEIASDMKNILKKYI